MSEPRMCLLHHDLHPLDPACRRVNSNWMRIARDLNPGVELQDLIRMFHFEWEQGILHEFQTTQRKVSK